MFSKLLGDSKTAGSDLHFEKQVSRSRDSMSFFKKIFFNWGIIALQLCVVSSVQQCARTLKLLILTVCLERGL